MSIKIDKTIVGFDVVKPDAAADPQPPLPQPSARPESAQPQPVNDKSAPDEASNIIQMHEALDRPEQLEGTTYKVKTPLSEHALYVTINDIVLNPGTPHEHRRPFEVFINSKNMDHFQWIVALTRIVSAVFRKGGDIIFLVEELKAVFDPRGGYFKRGGKFMPSLVAELGDVIEQHLRKIGILPDDLEDRQKAFIAAKRAEIEALETAPAPDGAADRSTGDTRFPTSATLCMKCNTKAMVQMDNCMTCLNCGESKCG